MRRLCKLVRSLSGSGDRRRSKSSREYPLSLSRHERNAVFLLPHGSTFIVSLGWVKIWTGLTLTFFKGIPHTDSFTPYVRLSCHLSSVRAVMLILDRSTLSRGLLHPRLPMPALSRACRNAGRWRQMGLWLGPRRQTKALRDLLLRSVSTTLPSPCLRNG